MDVVELPCVPGDTNLRLALEIMRKAKTSALVVRREKGAGLVELGDLLNKMNSEVEAGRDGNAPLVKLVVSRKAQRTMPDIIRKKAIAIHSARTANLHLGEDALESFKELQRETDREFRGGEGDFSILEAWGDHASVMTAHETLALSYASPTNLCTCAGPRVHIIPRRDVKRPGICNFLHAAELSCD